MNILYLDCSISGISGDMTLGALLDLGADRHIIEKELQQLPVEAFELRAEGVTKKGIHSTKIHIYELEKSAVQHRHYATIQQMIVDSTLSERAKAWALAIFEPIAHAEAKIHNTSLEKVHFHEVGAMDSIVDVLGVSMALDLLQIDKVYASPVVTGFGKIHIDHGIYPVPAPATLEMLKNIPIIESHVEAELTTPTGAGILKGLVEQFGPLPTMTVRSVGYGAGTKDFEHHPNVLRAVLGEA